MTRMLTTEELSQVFIDDNLKDVDETLEQLAAVGLTIEQAKGLWKVLGEEQGVGPVTVGVAFMAGVLVAKAHARLVALEAPPFYESGEA